LASLEPSFPITTSPGYPNTRKERFKITSYDDDSRLFHKDINNSLKEIQENRGKQAEAFKEEAYKYIKEIQENTSKQVKELNKTIQVLKMEIETIKKLQRETTLEIENLEKRSETIDASITNRIQEIEERISGALMKLLMSIKLQWIASHP
jgi:predicted  nucleic acid-binding Zn-ribbon protein